MPVFQLTLFESESIRAEVKGRTVDALSGWDFFNYSRPSAYIGQIMQYVGFLFPLRLGCGSLSSAVQMNPEQGSTGTGTAGNCDPRLNPPPFQTDVRCKPSSIGGKLTRWITVNQVQYSL